MWIDNNRKVSFYDGTQTFVATLDAAPDFLMFDLSDDDVIGWRQGPGSFWTKDARNLDSFSTPISWDPSIFGGLYYYFGNATPLRFAPGGSSSILFRDVQTNIWEPPGPIGPIGPVVDQGLLVALGPADIRQIPEPSALVPLALALLGLRLRMLR